MGAWIYGQGWYSPIYYGTLFSLGLVLRNRLAWEGYKEVSYIVIGVSLAHGAATALIVLLMYLAMGGWLLAPPAIWLTIYGLKFAIGAIAESARRRLDTAKGLLIRSAAGLFVILMFIRYLGYQLGGMH